MEEDTQNGSRTVAIDGSLKVAAGRYAARGCGIVQLCFDHVGAPGNGEAVTVPAMWICHHIRIKRCEVFFCFEEDIRAGSRTAHNSYRQLGSGAVPGQRGGAGAIRTKTQM